MGLKLAPLARRLAHFDVGQRQVVAVEQLGDLGGGRQRLVFGAAVVDGLGAQRLDARLELVERIEIRMFVHGSFTAQEILMTSTPGADARVR